MRTLLNEYVTDEMDIRFFEIQGTPITYQIKTTLKPSYKEESKFFNDLQEAQLYYESITNTDE